MENGQWPAYLICQPNFWQFDATCFDVFLLVCAEQEIVKIEKCLLAAELDSEF